MDTLEFITIFKGSKVKFTSSSVEGLARKAYRYLSQNGSDLSLESVRSMVDNQLKVRVSKPEGKRIPSLSEAYHASLAMFRFAQGETVDQKELDRRTSICLSCPLMTKTSFCSGCGGLSKATTLLNETRRLTRNKLKFHESIKTQFCDACGCGLPLLLSTKKEMLPKDESDAVRPSWCWIKD